jgi:hypothetical protein
LTSADKKQGRPGKSRRAKQRPVGGYVGRLRMRLECYLRGLNPSILAWPARRRIQNKGQASCLSVCLAVFLGQGMQREGGHSHRQLGPAMQCNAMQASRRAPRYSSLRRERQKDTKEPMKSDRVVAYLGWEACDWRPWITAIGGGGAASQRALIRMDWRRRDKKRQSNKDDRIGPLTSVDRSRKETIRSGYLANLITTKRRPKLAVAAGLA